MKKPLLAIFLGICFAYGAGLPTAAPEREGFSAERLNKINVVMREHVTAGRLAGASGLIARNGKVVFRENWGEMKPDSIVRMYSMTKGVTGVAAMILYEEGKFAMTDPLSKYLPEFAHMRVASGDGGKTVPAEHPITVRDLFRHTSGLDYTGPKDENGDVAYKKIEMVGGAPQVSFDLAEAVKRLATAPLNNEPGTLWRYGYSIDVLGRLVEVLSGKTLDRFFEERIFRPLGMKDTAFYVPEEKWSRLAVLYAPKKDGGVQRSTAPPQESFKKKPALFLGGAGLCSTLEDYSHFYAMLLNDGQYDGVRILGRKSVELMRSDHLGSIPHFGNTLPEWEGFGLTFAVNPGPGKSPDVGSQGTYRWGGAAGTTFWIDPKEHMFGIFLIQILPPNVGASGEFQRLAYDALVD
ncbi:MAG TPA: serine hydrolase domain-containing protein [Bryobacteraceae bacterium]|jgi:CubicO group peptidase (beta-lactamase class C family)|nr:serine hydrolase domain-containing protein [Bryobacteraceae bacterium]